MASLKCPIRRTFDRVFAAVKLKFVVPLVPTKTRKARSPSAIMQHGWRWGVNVRHNGGRHRRQTTLSAVRIGTSATP